MYRYATVVSALLLTTAAGSLAQTPLGTGFTFQGRVKQAGQLVNDSCDFEFTLWDAETDGGQVGPTLTFDAGSALPVNQGLFSAKLDFGASALDGDERWLAVAVGCPSGEALITVTPRQELTAAPAIFPATARAEAHPLIYMNAAATIVDVDDVFDNQQDGVVACDEAPYEETLNVGPGALLLADGFRVYDNNLVNPGAVPSLRIDGLQIGGSIPADLNDDCQIDAIGLAILLDSWSPRMS